MSKQPHNQSTPEISVDEGYFSSAQEVMADIAETGFWPHTYVSQPSPELPLHHHEAKIIGYLMEGETYILNHRRERLTMKAGDRLVIPAGAKHAEGEVTDRMVYVVTTENAENFFDALAPLEMESATP